MKAFFTFIFYWIIINGSAQIQVLTLASLTQHAEQENNETPPVKKMLGTGMIVRLHPSLGNAITPQTKREFGLFPEMPDSTFVMAQLVKYDDSTYTFIFRTTKNVRTERTVTVNQLLYMYIAVEKIKPAPPAPQVPVAVASSKQKKSSRPDPNKNEVPALDALGTVINTSLQILAFLSNFDGHHHNNGSNYYDRSGKYDPSQSYLSYPQDHYIPKDGEDN